MRVLSLFSGIGCHDVGLEWAGMTIVGQVEIDDFCTKTLEKHWPKVPRFRDIRRVTANDIRRRCGHVDIITGGFPCQDISTAGKQKGLVEGQRSGLWREMWRIIRYLRPNWVLLENVPALRTKGSDTVIGALEALGYSCWPLVVGAWAVGAPHQRNRVWIVGYCQSRGQQGWEVAARLIREGLANFTGTSRSLGDTDGTRTRKRTRQRRIAISTNTSQGDPSFAFPRGPGPEQHDWEEPRTIKPALGAATDGNARGLVRWYRNALKAIGNANPPTVPYLIGLAIMEIEQWKK